MLSLLLCLEIQPGESAQVLLADRLVDGGAATNSLPVVVGSVGPPVSLHLHVPDKRKNDFKQLNSKIIKDES